MKKQPFLYLFLSYFIGVILADKMNITIEFSISLFLVFFISYFYISSRTKYVNKYLTSHLLVIISSIGILNYALISPKNQHSNLINHYLKGDTILGFINEINPSKKNFIKTEFHVKQIIRNKDTIPVEGKILLFIQDTVSKLRKKDVLILNTELNSFKNNKNPGEFDSESYWKHKGIQFLGFCNLDSYYIIGKEPGHFMDLFDDLSTYFSNLLDTYLDGDELAVANALIIGDKSSLDAEIRNKFSNAGAMHVLAVSGLHVGILVQLLSYFLTLFKRFISKNRAIILVLILVWIYALVTGFSASVVRASFMFSVLSLANLLGKNNEQYNTLAFSALIILIWNPNLLFDIGFQLSYLAMLGIFMFYKPLSKVFVVKNKWIQKLIEGTMVGVAAQIMTVPLTLYYFHQFPNYFMLTNIGLMVTSFLVLAFGLMLFAFNFVPLLNKLIAFALFLSLYLTIQTVNFVDDLPGSVALGFELNFLTVICFFISIILFFYSLKKKIITLFYSSLALSVIIVFIMVFQRFKNLYQNEICFFNTNEVVFSVKVKDKGFVFFCNYKNEVKNVKYLVENYNKIKPQDVELINLKNKKCTYLKVNSNEVKINRVKGGYEIKINKTNYFYATDSKFKKTDAKILYANWLNDNSYYNLKNGAYREILALN